MTDSDQPIITASVIGAVVDSARSCPVPRPAHRARLVAACHNAAMGFDLVIRGATVVTPGHREAADIGIAGGRIAQLGGTMTGALLASPAAGSPSSAAR